MHYKTKEELIRKIGLLGTKDLRKIAPIGDIGYANGWYPPFFWKTTWADTEMPKMIIEAAYEQGFKFEIISYNHRGTDTHYYCAELGLHYHVDSSD